jgi:ATP-dependent helicase/nuclease subunit A
MEQGRDEVRILTVHNAKGLEAPVVFLPDTTSRPGAHRARRIVPLELPGGWTLPAVSRSKGEDVALVEAARADLARAEDEEHRRLLYVALTRAADRLVIAGFPNGRDKEPNERSWYALVRDALAPQAVAEHDEEGEVVRWVWRNDEPGVAAAAGGPGEAADAALPPWVGRSPPAAPAVAAFAPSRAAAAGPAPRRRNRHAGDAAEAAARGDIMHRLLQALPDLPPSRRRDAALRFAARELPALAEEIAAEACALLEGPAFAPFFASGSAEVPVAGEVALPSGRVVRVDGRLDRLTVGDGVADVLDYKTGPRPARAPEAYVTQLALYREVVRAALPGRAVRCHLLWTAAPALETLDDAALDAALAALGGAGPLP